MGAAAIIQGAYIAAYIPMGPADIPMGAAVAMQGVMRSYLNTLALQHTTSGDMCVHCSAGPLCLAKTRRNRLATL